MDGKDNVRTKVSERYERLAENGYDCSGQSDNSRTSCCCVQPENANKTITQLGFFYSDQEAKAAPKGSFMGLGCGNPTALANLKEGETVLDLGSGGGFDCFLASSRVGAKGWVIGVDMTPKMITKARANAERETYQNVEFRLGELEHLPVADRLVDVIISNCVVNLSPDKVMVFREAFRVLKPGGRLMIMDMVAKTDLPDRLRSDPSLYCACIGGAAEVGWIERRLTEIGFDSIRINFKDQQQYYIDEEVNEDNIYKFVSPASIRAVKPKTADIKGPSRKRRHG